MSLYHPAPWPLYVREANRMIDVQASSFQLHDELNVREARSLHGGQATIEGNVGQGKLVQQGVKRGAFTVGRLRTNPPSVSYLFLHLQSLSHQARV